MERFSKEVATTDVAISVEGLVDYIKTTLEGDPTLHRLWLIGEVSSANRHTKGLFFTLKDLEGSAAINCVVWRSQFPRLSHLPQMGEQITVLGSVRVYPQRSNYQLNVWQVLPTGDGLRALRYRQLKARLTAEGVFDPEFKQPLPTFPHILGVVSSPQAAAWGDIQRTLKAHHPGLHLLFSPATVQGETAPASIVRAIQRLVADGRAEVLILARGGGASEDLEGFDDERVVRAVADCPIPVVTGIGHQRDESLTDLAADVCAHTPTAAATLAVPALDELVESHRQRAQRLNQLVVDELSFARAGIDRLQQRLLRGRLDQQIQQQQVVLQQLRRRLRQTMQTTLRQHSGRCQALREHLMSLDPETVIKRGYALVRDEAGQVVADAASVSPGQSLQVQLAKGRMTVTVTEACPETPDHASD
jgi:exodeoxyribonuclease VII large subunit